MNRRWILATASLGLGLTGTGCVQVNGPGAWDPMACGQPRCVALASPCSQTPPPRVVARPMTMPMPTPQASPAIAIPEEAGGYAVPVPRLGEPESEAEPAPQQFTPELEPVVPAPPLPSRSSPRKYLPVPPRFAANDEEPESESEERGSRP